jgi:hypothetical protein
LRHRIQHPATEFILPKMQPIPKTQQIYIQLIKLIGYSYAHLRYN